MLVSASKDTTLKVGPATLLMVVLRTDLQLWDLKTFKIRIDLPGHTDEVYCVDFVADKVVSGGRDKTVKMWVYFLPRGLHTDIVAGRTRWIWFRR